MVDQYKLPNGVTYIDELLGGSGAPESDNPKGGSINGQNPPAAHANMGAALQQIARTLESDARGDDPGDGDLPQYKERFAILAARLQNQLHALNKTVKNNERLLGLITTVTKEISSSTSNLNGLTSQPDE